MEATSFIQENWFEKKEYIICESHSKRLYSNWPVSRSVNAMLHSRLFGSSSSPCLHCFCVWRQCCKRLWVALHEESCSRAHWLWLLSSSSSDDEIFLVEDPGVKCAPFSSLALFFPPPKRDEPSLLFYFLFFAFPHWKIKLLASSKLANSQKREVRTLLVWHGTFQTWLCS